MPEQETELPARRKRQLSAATGRPLKINYPKRRVSVACDVCRARKTRCDARRPSCSFCSEVDVECVYRVQPERRPVKATDYSYTPDIIDRLGRLESLIGSKEHDLLCSSPQTTEDPSVETAAHASPVHTVGSIQDSFLAQGVNESPLGYRHDLDYYSGGSQSQHVGISPCSDSPSSTDQAVSTTRHPHGPPLFGYRLDSLSRLGAGAPVLPSLATLCTVEDNVNHELESELYGSDTTTSGLFLSGAAGKCSESIPDTPNSLDLSARTCWHLEQSFSRDVLPWFPIIEQKECSELVARVAEGGFARNQLETALAFLIMALGSFARDNRSQSTDIRRNAEMSSSSQNQSTEAQTSYPGMGYYHAGREVIHNTSRYAKSRYSIKSVQCDLLVTFYLLYCLKPLLAFEVLASAGLRLVMLLQLRSNPGGYPGTISVSRHNDDDPTYNERLNRAYWTCYLLEHELQAHVSFSAILLQERRDYVPLPLSNYDEPGMYWFLSEIALRGICSSMHESPGVAWTQYMLDAPLLIEEVSLQLLEWHSNLARPIRFSVDDPTKSTQDPLALAPLLDPHKVFLRAQFYAIQATLRWPFVVHLLSSSNAASPGDACSTVSVGTSPIKPEQAKACLGYAVLHIYTVEPLMQDRHLMLFANIAGLFCVAMLLLSAHNIPQLAEVAHPGAEAAVQQAVRYLRRWGEKPSVRAMISRLELLGMSKGIEL